jgi:IBR domain, a half RING-finger domain/IBR domain/Zinc finger, C3HC4 type (RING finger)
MMNVAKLKEELNSKIATCSDDNELIDLMKEYEQLREQHGDSDKVDVPSLTLSVDADIETSDSDNDDDGDDDSEIDELDMIDEKESLDVCLICYDEDVSSWHRLECGHAYCSACLAEMIAVLLREAANADVVRCPNPECQSPLDYGDVCAIADDDSVVRFERFSFSRGLAPFAVNRVTAWCATPGCESALVQQRQDDDDVLECDRCAFSMCRQCGEASHGGATCEQFAEWRRHNDVHHSEADWWIRWNTKPCPHCGTPISKNGGCPMMHCTNCNRSFNWTMAGTPLQRATALVGYGAAYIVVVPIAITVAAKFALPLAMLCGSLALWDSLTRY